MRTPGDYFTTLRERAKESRVHKKYQLDGLEIADILGDRKHTALYIKLAKQGNAQRLRELAADVAQRPNIKNKGAFFMYALSNPPGTGAPRKTPMPQKRKARKSSTKRKQRTHG